MVDVLDVDRALLNAGAAGGAGPEHIGVDHAQCCGVTYQWAGGLQGRVGGDPAEAGLWHVVFLGVALTANDFANATDRGVLGRGLLVIEDVGRLGEEMVAKIHDDQLGRQRLSGVPRRALGLAPATLGAGGQVQIALPAEVFDLAAAEHRVFGGILEVDQFALGFHRQQRTESVRQPLECHVERRQADVQVFGVEHDQEEHQHHADMQQ